jgi:hypothetical protein
MATSQITPEFEAKLHALGAHIQLDYDKWLVLCNLDRAGKGKNVEYQYGKKYIRVVTSDSHAAGRSAHCFVEIATGNILKAASWASPAKNFSRGNIFTDISRVTWTGAN